MVNDFDDFAAKHKKEGDDRKRLAEEMGPEWVVLKGFVAALAQDGKEFDGRKLEWFPDAECLVLGDVAAYFLHRERNGKPQDCLIRFDRRPAPLGKHWHDEQSPLTPVFWSLEPTLVDDSFHWSITNVGVPRPDFSSADLSQKVGKKLAEYHLAYRKHYEGWSPAKITG
jgi:hypothetical protein